MLMSTPVSIGKWDEYMIHQKYSPINDSGDVGRESLYFGCHNTDGSLHLALGLASFAKNNVMDAYICLREKGTQHNLRLSRHIDGDRADTRIGPLSVQVIEPLKRWRLDLAKNDFGLRFSLDFECRGVPYATTYSRLFRGLHYNQPGQFTGTISIGNKEYKVAGYPGARDRTMRIQYSEYPKQMENWEGHLWFVAPFDKFWVSLQGLPYWKGGDEYAAAILYDNGSISPIKELYHRVEFLPAIRSMQKVDFLLIDSTGKKWNLTVQPISPGICMSGAKYEDQGKDKGTFSIEGEEWDVSQPSDVGSPHFGKRGMTEYIVRFDIKDEAGHEQSCVGVFEISYSPDKQVQYQPSLR